MTVALVVLAGGAFLAAPWLVALIAPGFEGAQLERTIELTRLMLLAPMFLALGAVATSALNAHRRFAASAIAPIVYDLAIIGAAFLLAPSMGVTGLALGVVAGSLLHLLVQLPALSRAGFRLTPSLDARDPDVSQALKLMAPRALALGAGQVTFIVATSLATGLDLGSVTAFTLAFTVFSIPLSVIGVPLGIVALPTLSRDLARGAIDEFVELVTRALRMIAFVIGPIVALGIVLREPAATILFNHGRFSEDGVRLVAATLAPAAARAPGRGADHDPGPGVLCESRYAHARPRGDPRGRDQRRRRRPGGQCARLGARRDRARDRPRVDGRGDPPRGRAAAGDPGASIRRPLVRVGVPVALASVARGAGRVRRRSALLDGATAGLALHVRAIVQLVVAGGLGGLAYLGVTWALRLPELGLIMRLMSDTLSRVRPA